MKSLRDIIVEHSVMEGFFKNTNTATRNPHKWFGEIAINASQQYDTLYNTKTCIRDCDKYTITFTNKYKKNNVERNLTIDLGPYMAKLIEKYEGSNILVELSTGLWDKSNEGMKFKHQERIEQAEAKGTYFDNDKKIKVKVYLCQGVNPAPQLEMISGQQVNKMMKYEAHDTFATTYAQHRQNQRSKMIPLLGFKCYLNDYPFDSSNIFVDFNNLDKVD